MTANGLKSIKCKMPKNGSLATVISCCVYVHRLLWWKCPKWIKWHRKTKSNYSNLLSCSFAGMFHLTHLHNTNIGMSLLELILGLFMFGHYTLTEFCATLPFLKA